MKNMSLWSKNFSFLMLATTMGAIGGIAGSYAMSFFVFDETSSTLAAGFLSALQIVPHFLLPILVAPLMDRLPRKTFLVYGDLAAGVLYGLAGLYLLKLPFSYPIYLVFSLIINCINAFDSLAFNCIFPKTIPEGFEEKGFTVSAMLYPVLNVLIMPLSAVLMDWIGVGNILLLQSFLSVLASIIENRIRINEIIKNDGENCGFKGWFTDFLDGFRYLKGEKGLLNIHLYSAVTNGAANGYSSIMVAFFRTAPGFSAQMYAFFSVAEFLGRTAGGIFRYRSDIKKEKRQGFVYFVQQFYNIMDAVLLWLPYPLMLLNRSFCGFLGINSATVRESSVQRYLPEKYRARVNAFSSALICAAGSAASFLIGLMGEFMEYRTIMTAGAFFSMVACVMTIWRSRKKIKAIYDA